tara:strand:+ start:2701 stop:2904 length:204 start_codon:yes stop_codon:yes gene_type:complete
MIFDDKLICIVLLNKLICFYPLVMVAPDNSEKHFKDKWMFFLGLKSEQRKLLKVIRKNHLLKKSCSK